MTERDVKGGIHCPCTISYANNPSITNKGGIKRKQKKDGHIPERNYKVSN